MDRFPNADLKSMVDSNLKIYKSLCGLYGPIKNTILYFKLNRGKENAISEIGTKIYQFKMCTFAGLENCSDIVL